MKKWLVAVAAVVVAAVAVFFIPQQEPSLVAFVEPSAIHRGETALLSWDSDNVKELYLEATGADVRKLDSSGEINISPAESTVFILRGLGKNGKIILKEVALSVIQPLPQVSLTVEPAVIRKGESATLRWETTGATVVNISGIGDVPISGSKTVSPPSTTEYIVTATGGGGTVEQTVDLTVLDPPPIFVVNPKYHKTAELIEVKEGDQKFWLVSMEVPKGTQIRTPYSGEFYHGWRSILGQMMVGITVEHPSVKEFQRGVSVNAVDLVFNKEQDRMVEKGEVVAEADKAGKIFINFGNATGNDEEMFRLHFPSLFNETK